MDEIVPHPVFFVTYEQKDISSDITPFITSITFVDHLSDESGELELELEDRDGKWIGPWYPGKTDRLSLRIGYDQSPLLPCGQFEIDEISFSSPPDVVYIRALATGPKKALRTRNSHAYENTTLAVIAQRVAKRNGLTLVGSVREVKIDRVTQLQEQDLSFLMRIGRSYGYAFKVQGDNLVFTELSTLREQEPVTTLRKQDVIEVEITDKIKGVVAKSQVKHYNSKQKKLVTYTVNQDSEIVVKGGSGSFASADTLKGAGRASDPETARVKAQAAIDRSNYDQTQGRLLCYGNPKLVAGNSFDLLDYGQLSGKYVVHTATHHIDRSAGYTTEVEIKRAGADAKKKAKQRKGKKSNKNKGPLTVYTLDKSGNVVTK